MPVYKAEYKGVLIMTTCNDQVHVGIDVSKETLDVFILPNNTHFKTTNNKAG